MCGYVGVFELRCRSRREGYLCPGCRASARYQHQAQTIATLFGASDLAALVDQPAFADLRIYEPGVIGPFRKYWARLPHCTNSYFWPDVGLGQVHEGLRCESLEALTFPDASFDLVVTADIFEHVRRPWAAFEAIAHVLTPGGVHVMAIPTAEPLPRTSEPRVDTTSEVDVMLKEPIYHGSPKDPNGSLVYTDFGADLPQRLTAWATR